MNRQISNQSNQLISESQSDKEKQPVKKNNIKNKKNSITNISKKIQSKNTYSQLKQQNKQKNKIHQLDHPQLQQTSKNTTDSLQQFQDLPKRIIKNYQQKVAKQYQNNQSLIPISSSQTNKILIHLKQIHLQQQISQVKKIKEVSQQSKLILDDLTNIQTEIDKYHDHIELWIAKIRALEGNIETIKTVERSFQKKAVNMSKLRDFLYVQRTRRR